MSGPFLPARAAQPLDLLEQSYTGGAGWDDLDLDALRAALPDNAPLKPSDEIARFMFGLYSTAEGRRMFEWLMDITIRQPLRATGPTIEETALRTATRQGINGVAEAVLAAIALGESLINKPRQNGAGS